MKFLRGALLWAWICPLALGSPLKVAQKKPPKVVDPVACGHVLAEQLYAVDKNLSNLEKRLGILLNLDGSSLEIFTEDPVVVKGKKTELATRATAIQEKAHDVRVPMNDVMRARSPASIGARRCADPAAVATALQKMEVALKDLLGKVRALYLNADNRAGVVDYPRTHAEGFGSDFESHVHDALEHVRVVQKTLGLPPTDGAT